MSSSDKEQRFIKTYNSYIDEIYSYVFLKTGLDKVTAEDITQEIFLDVFNGFNKFKGLCSERTWVFKIARNKVYDYYRKQYKRCMESISIDAEKTEQFFDPDQDVEALIEKACESKAVLTCLNSLPQHYKITLLLKYVDGRSVKEIAIIFDKSNKAIDNVLQRAKLQFIKQYQTIQQRDKQSL
jgi:RNA polymerase sigma-70 factor, ECF subfamily